MQGLCAVSLASMLPGCGCNSASIWCPVGFRWHLVWFCFVLLLVCICLCIPCGFPFVSVFPCGFLFALSSSFRFHSCLVSKALIPLSPLKMSSLGFVWSISKNPAPFKVLEGCPEILPESADLPPIEVSCRFAFLPLALHFISSQFQLDPIRLPQKALPSAELGLGRPWKCKEVPAALNRLLHHVLRSPTRLRSQRLGPLAVFHLWLSWAWGGLFDSRDKTII